MDVGVVFVTWNHNELGVESGKDEFNEVNAESTQPVFVGNHNLSDIALEDPFQKGDKFGSLVVEPAADVGIDEDRFFLAGGIVVFFVDAEDMLDIIESVESLGVFTTRGAGG
jgi:hypothetical protein